MRASSAEFLQLRNAGQPAKEQQGRSVRSRRTCSSDVDGTVSSFRCRELHQCQAKNLCQQPISKVVQSGLIPAKEVVTDQLDRDSARLSEKIFPAMTFWQHFVVGPCHNKFLLV